MNPGRGKNNKSGKPDRKSNGKPNKRPFKKQSTSVAKAPEYDFEQFKKVEDKKQPEKSSDIRLNRYIAKAGICSRREADALIQKGEIKVNGQLVTEMGYKVMPEDSVTYKGKKLKPEKLFYVLLNKPKDVITTVDDPEDRRTVMDIVKNACDERIYPVGRLDRGTTGLLLLTNDGDVTKRLSHPSSKVKKIYQIELDKPISASDFDKILEGVELEDGFIQVDEMAIVGNNNQVIGLEIHSGRNRIVRRIFEHFDYRVTKLDRVMFANLTKKDLPRGKWRFLTQSEVIKLKHLGK